MQNDQRTFYELAPLVPLAEWWHLMLLIAITGGLIGFAIFFYRRDAKSLPRPIAFLLTSLRVAAIGGMLVFLLGPQLRSETRLVKPSELAILIDTSLSMGLTDEPQRGKESSRRIDQAIELVQDSSLLAELRQHHRISIYRFGDTPYPEAIATIEKTGAPTSSSVSTSHSASEEPARWLGTIGIVSFLVASLLLLVSGWVAMRWSKPSKFSRAVYSGSCLAGGWLLILAVTLFALTDLRTSELSLWQSLGWTDSDLPTRASLDQATPEPSAIPFDPLAVADWQDELAPRATATRLGGSLQHLIDQLRGGAAAGIIVVSDGRSNAGPPPARAISAAEDANLPLYVVGIGSTQTPRNIRVSNIQAPPSVFPGDRFQIKTILQSQGMKDESVRVQLLSAPRQAVGSGATPQSPTTETLVDEQTIRAADDGDPQTVKFQLEGQPEGALRYTVRITPPTGDLDATDNQRHVDVRVQIRKTKILLIAGGPTRDYQFLRNQLFRDRDSVLDVWLQMAKPGTDQESDTQLFEFPNSLDTLNQYDGIIAFDPDWRRLSLAQTRWLEKWVSEKAGGMIVVAGPVFTPEWTRQPRGDEAIDLIRRLYPVSFYSQGSAALKLGRFGGETSFPLLFTREGIMAEHLWLGETLAQSQANWQRFAGVFGYYAVNEPKIGADILAHFSDQTTAVNDQLPIYLATHYYGAGRVLFQASGEIWRLRDVGVDHFQKYYQNLIRWIVQGRMLRESNRGILLVDHHRCWVGDQVTVQAILRDLSDQPLQDAQVMAILHRPHGPPETVPLTHLQDASRPGTYSGLWVATMEGDYQISLPVPGGSQGETLTAEVQASIPELEKKQPQRHDALLSQMASRTGGVYFDHPKKCLSTTDGLANLIKPVAQETFLPGTPNTCFTEKLMAWLLGWITLALALEWTIRRLHKLA